MTATLSNNLFSVQINKLGAELSSVKNMITGIEYIWQADPQYWARHAPILFPIVGRLKNDQYSFNQNVYKLTQHGFARDQNFKIVSQSTTDVVFELRESELSLPKYPFSFILQNRYSLVENSLNIEYYVSNSDQKDIYFSVGGHPAFNIPLIQNLKFDNYFCEITPNIVYDRIVLKNSTSDFNHLEKFSEKRFQIQRNLFANDAIILILNQKETKVSLVSERDEHGVSMILENANYVGVWSPYPKEAPFVCIEPWWGIHDTINSDGDLTRKHSIIKLQPNEKFSGKYRLEFF